MLFKWLSQRRRRKILARPFPAEWSEVLGQNVLHVALLNREQQSKLRKLVQVFVAEKNWEGCAGLVLSDEIKVTIAAQASLLVVGRQEDFYFDDVLSVLVYPTGYVAPSRGTGQAGVVDEEGEARLGEAWYRGPVVLSWLDVLAGGRLERPGHNLVLHEFAHQLDMLNGDIVDGVPPLPSTEIQRWTEIFQLEFEQLVDACRYGRMTWLNCYGATSPAEFFAVVTESFFERPHAMYNHNPKLYALLRNFYCIDPLAWNWSQ